MILTYHEGGCVRASAGDTTIVFGPVSKGSRRFRPTNFGADIALISLNDSDMNGADEASRGDKEPFIVSGPGEYEVSGISILYLGAIDETTLPSELSEMDEPDIIFVPISADGTLSPSDANKLCVNLEAKIVIPIFYNEQSLKQFLKEAGEEKPEKVEKLTLKPRDLVGKEGDVIVLIA